MSSTRKPLHNGGKSQTEASGGCVQCGVVAARCAVMPRGSRLIERFYAECYAPFLTRGYNALWLYRF